MKTTLALLASSLISSALAATHSVRIGPGLNYSPDTLTGVAQGDIVEFTFGSGHNVVSGTFDAPCQQNGAVYSGEQNDGDVFSLIVNSTDPMWLYCSIPGHCQGGMAMVINPPSDQTLDSYKSAAQNAPGSTSPQDITGGVLGVIADSSSSSSSSASGDSSTTMSSSGSSSTSASMTTSASAGSSSSASSASASATASGSGAGAVAVGSGSGLIAAIVGLVALL